MTWSLYICQDFKDNVSQSGQKRKWCPFNFSSCIQECWRLSVSCFPFILRKNAVSLSPPVINVCGRFWEKPLPSDCFMTKCVFSRMCPSSHVLSHLLGELTQRHEHSQTCTKNSLTRMRFLTNAHTFSVSHTHAHEFPGGQAGGLAGTEMNTCWDQSSSVWFTFLSLSFFQSLASRFVLSLTPDSHLSLLSLPPSVFENLSVSNVFRTQTHQRTVPEPIVPIIYLWLKSGDFCPLWKNHVWFFFWILHSIPDFCPFLMYLVGYQTPHYSNLESMALSNGLGGTKNIKCCLIL